jgi:hypothetical protein
MTRPRQPDPSPPPGTRPPEYVIEAWVSPQIQDRIRRPVTRTSQRQPNPQREARHEEPAAERTPGLLDRSAQPHACRQAEPEFEAG